MNKEATYDLQLLIIAIGFYILHEITLRTYWLIATIVAAILCGIVMYSKETKKKPNKK